MWGCGHTGRNSGIIKSIPGQSELKQVFGTQVGIQNCPGDSAEQLVNMSSYMTRVNYILPIGDTDNANGFDNPDMV